MDLSRRSFLGGAIALTAATLLPLDAVASTVPSIHGDGVHDDTNGLQALLDGEPFRIVGERPMRLSNEGHANITGGTYRVTRPLIIREDCHAFFFGGTLLMGHSGPLIETEARASLDMSNMVVSPYPRPAPMPFYDSAPFVSHTLRFTVTG